MADTEVISHHRGNSAGSAAYSYNDLRGRERAIYLATPKTSKAIWLTSLGPKLEWGNQEMMWPVSDAALNADSTPRLENLATPKKNFRSASDYKKAIYVHSCGRESVIWDVSPMAKKASPSQRVNGLAQSKNPPSSYQEDRAKHAFSCGRQSPVWQVSGAARGAKERVRLEGLSRPKTPHRDYIPPREVESVVTSNAKNATASSRLETLARPKSRPEGPFREPMWPVMPLAKSANPSSRQLELAKPKGIPDGYQAPRATINDIKRSARRAIATSRTQELSRPIMRATMDHVQFNPDAFIVSEAAKKAKCPARIEELSVPLTR